MTNSQDTSAATRYLIENLKDVYTRDQDGPLVAWVLVGDIEIAESYGYRVALEAWAGEQATEPPLGAYRVVKHESFGSSLVEFELLETREREVRQIERAEQVRADLTTLSIAAQTQAENTRF